MPDSHVYMLTEEVCFIQYKYVTANPDSKADEAFYWT